MAHLKITKWDGFNEVEAWTVPNYSDTETRTLLQRMVCTTLTPSEVIAASRRRNDPERSSLLDPIATGRVLDYGEAVHFTAELVS